MIALGLVTRSVYVIRSEHLLSLAKLSLKDWKCPSKQNFGARIQSLLSEVHVEGSKIVVGKKEGNILIASKYNGPALVRKEIGRSGVSRWHTASDRMLIVSCESFTNSHP